MAIAESESPGATTYGFGRTEVPVGRGVVPCAGAVFTSCAGAVFTSCVRGCDGASRCAGSFAGACAARAGDGPPRVSPAPLPQVGHAPGPWPARTFSATAICWSLVARSARGAWAVPPKARQVFWLNWSPP